MELRNPKAAARQGEFLLVNPSGPRSAERWLEQIVNSEWDKVVVLTGDVVCRRIVVVTMH
jgi:hypothetical protein